MIFCNHIVLQKLCSTWNQTQAFWCMQKPPYGYNIIEAFSTIASFPQLLKCDIDMVVSYHGVAPTSTAMSNAVHQYWKCYVHKCCNTDVLGVLPIYQHSPLGEVKPIAAMLQHINTLHICIHSFSIHNYIFSSWALDATSNIWLRMW